MALVKAGGIAANKRVFLALGIHFMQQMSGKLLCEYFLDFILLATNSTVRHFYGCYIWALVNGLWLDIESYTVRGEMLTIV